MGKQELALLIPIAALMIPIVAIVFTNLTKMARLKAEAQQGLPGAEARMAAIEEDMAALRQELSETQERLDFTERLLAQKSSADQPKGAA